MKADPISGAQRGRLARLIRWIKATRLFRLFHSDFGEVTAVCNRAAAGDLEARILGVDPRSSFGRMCTAINRVLDIADSFTRETAAAMHHCSHDRYHRPILRRGLRGSYLQSAGVINQAALLMKTHSDNIRFVAAQAAETAHNVHAVAAACEQLNASTVEISSQTKGASRNASDVASLLGAMHEDIQRLQGAVAKIDGMVELLSTVCIQTQLLGLNASIEAAHAGDQGSGFSVVAQEVKGLSDETRRASTQIGLELHEIKQCTGDAVRTLGAMTEIIERVQASSGSIDLSVQEQLKATDSISTSIVSVSEKSEEIARRIRRDEQAA